ncbi:MAG: DUF86 domain-containing protein [Ginsengibacter sp.]
MSEREIKNLLEDIYDAAEKIIAYTRGMSFDNFMQDEKTIDAVVRNFEIIGEAANKVPDDFKTDHPQIEWLRIIGFRNRIIHEYFGIDYDILWKIKEVSIPVLLEFIEQILADLNSESS